MSNHIPESWLSKTILQKRIVTHWTVTSYEPDDISLDSYHIVIDGDGGLHRGSSNLDERAPHCYGLNSAIGISLACVGGYVSSSNPGPYPPTKEQWESLVSVVKQLCDRYDIPVTPTTVLQHGEVYDNLLIDQWGKIDIGCLPHLGLSGAHAVGDELRSRVMGADTDTKVIEVAVRVTGYDKIVKGMLMDGTTMVPIRAFAKGIPALEIVKIDLSSFPKQAYLKFNSAKKHIVSDLLLVGDTGYVELKSLCDAIGWITIVESWSKDKRVVISRPKSN